MSDNLCTTCRKPVEPGDMYEFINTRAPGNVQRIPVCLNCFMYHSIGAMTEALQGIHRCLTTMSADNSFERMATALEIRNQL